MVTIELAKDAFKDNPVILRVYYDEDGLENECERMEGMFSDLVNQIPEEADLVFSAEGHPSLTANTEYKKMVFEPSDFVKKEGRILDVEAFVELILDPDVVFISRRWNDFVKVDVEYDEKNYQFSTVQFNERHIYNLSDAQCRVKDGNQLTVLYTVGSTKGKVDFWIYRKENL